MFDAQNNLSLISDQFCVNIERRTFKAWNEIKFIVVLHHQHNICLDQHSNYQTHVFFALPARLEMVHFKCQKIEWEENFCFRQNDVDRWWCFTFYQNVSRVTMMTSSFTLVSVRVQVQGFSGLQSCLCWNKVSCDLEFFNSFLFVLNKQKASIILRFWRF